MGKSHRPSASLIVACVALIMALAGSAIALPGKNSVKKNDIAKGAVTKKAIKKNAVVSKAIKDGSVTNTKLADGAVNGAKVADESLATGDISDIQNSGLVKAAATAGANYDAARDAAPKQVLLQKGPITIYGKCFTDQGGPQTYAMVYAETTAAGTAMLSGYDYLPGEDYLEPNTPEDDREVLRNADASQDNANGWRNLVTVVAPDGSVIEGVVSAFAKNGTLTDGDGPYGAGDQCLFKASSIG